MDLFGTRCDASALAKTKHMSMRDATASPFVPRFTDFSPCMMLLALVAGLCDQCLLLSHITAERYQGSWLLLCLTAIVYMGGASSDQICHCQVCLGKYALLEDEENPRLAMFERRLPCFGCGIGWCSFLLGFLCPLIWYYAALLYCCKYYNRDPRERSGLAASAVVAVLFTVVTIVTLSVMLIICANK